MTGEVKADGRRKRSHQRSKSSIGDYSLPIHLDPIKDMQMIESPNAAKATEKDRSRSWFKSKKPTQPNPETSDLEVEEKPFQRVVQGLYRDDDGGPSPKILVTSHSAARDAVKEFAKEFVAQLKAGDPDAALAMASQMRHHLHLTAGSPPTDLKFIAQAYIAHHLFSDFENASFGIPHAGEKPWEVQDHMRRCFAQFQMCKTKSQTVSTLLENESTDSSFLSQLCMKKFRTIVPLDSGGAFFGGDCRHHLELEKGHHPDTPFYRCFLGAAVSVWLLQRLAFSFEQKIITIFPTGGDAFQRRFMTPVVPGIGDTEEEENDGGLEIAFAVFPGFRVSESIVESLVYIVESPPKIDMSTSDYSVVERPVETTSGNRDESSSVTLRSQKSFKGGEHGLLQKIRSKFTRKKTLVKGTVVADNIATVTAAPPLEEPVPLREDAAPPLEESAPSRGELAAPLTDDVEENTTSVTNAASVPSELSSPSLQPLNSEVTDSYVPPSNPSSLGVDDDERLYIPRAEKSRLLQSALKSPRLSSVD